MGTMGRKRAGWALVLGVAALVGVCAPGSVFAEALRTVPWAMSVDAPASAATTSPAKANPRMKVDFSNSAKLIIVGLPARPTIVAWYDGIKVRDIASNTDRGGIGKEVEFSDSPVAGPDGRFIALVKGRGNSKGPLAVYDSRTGRSVAEFAEEGFELKPLAFADAQTLAVVVTRTDARNWGPCKLRMVEATTGKALSEVELPEKPKVARASLTGKYLGVCLSNQAAFIDVKKGEIVGVLGSQEKPPTDIAFSPDGKEIALAVSTRENFRGNVGLVIYDVQTGGEVSHINVPPPPQNVYNRLEAGLPIVQWFPDGKALLVEPNNVIDRQSGKLIYDFSVVGAPSYGYTGDISRWVVANDQVLFLGNPPGRGFTGTRCLIIEEVPRKRLDKVSDELAKGGDLIDIDLPKETQAVPLPEAPSEIRLPGPHAITKIDGMGPPPPGASPDDPGGRIRETTPILTNVSVQQVHSIRPDFPQVVVQYNISGGSNFNKAPLAIQRVDIVSGQEQARLETKFPAKLLDVSPDGTQALLLPDRNAKDRVDIFELDMKSKSVVAFRPAIGNEVTWAGFVDNTHVLTLNKSGILTGWELPACKATFAVSVRTLINPRASLSTGRKQVAVLGNIGLAVLDSSTGEVLTSYPLSSQIPRTPVFSPDGKHIAIANSTYRNTYLTVADLTSDAPVRESILPAVRLGEHATHSGNDVTCVQWIGNDYIFIDSVLLTDVKRGITIWRAVHTYAVPSAQGAAVLGRYIFPNLAGERGGHFGRTNVLGSAKIPTPDVERITAAFSAESLTALTVGAPIAINFGPISPNDEYGKRIVAGVKECGFKVVDSSPNVLTFATPTISSGEMGVGDIFHIFKPSAKVSTRDVLVTAVLSVNGKEVWRDFSHAYYPQSAYLQKGENEQAAFDREHQKLIGDHAATMAGRLPERVINSKFIPVATLPGVFSDNPEVNVRAEAAPARDDQEKACAQALGTLLPQLNKFQDMANGIIEGVTNKSIDAKAFSAKVNELSRLRNELPAIENMDQLLPAETESYRKILDTSAAAIKNFRSVAGIYTASGSGSKANEFFTKGSGQFKGTIKSEVTWLQKRLEELNAKNPAK